MYPLLAPLVWLFIMAIITGVTVIDNCAVYQNTIINKTRAWPFWVSSIVVVLMTTLAYNTILVLFESVAHRAIIQSMVTGIISVFLIITIWLSLTGMARRLDKKFADFIGNI